MHFLYRYGLSAQHTTSFWNIITQWTSNDNLTENFLSLIFVAKLIKWQKFKTAICDVMKKWLPSNFLRIKIWHKSSNQFWRPNPWMDPVQKFFYNFNFCSFFCRLSCFYGKYWWFSFCSKRQIKILQDGGHCGPLRPFKVKRS